jgi:hypothetical protein
MRSKLAISAHTAMGIAMGLSAAAIAHTQLTQAMEPMELEPTRVDVPIDSNRRDR